MNKFSGLIAAPFAPMSKNGELLYENVTPYYDFLKKNKVVGAFINGSSGEGVSLSGIEKMKMVECWTKAAGSQKAVKIITLIAGTSYIECAENAIHAQECGVHAIALVAPYYFRPATAEELAEYCAKVAEAVPNLPIYFYHIPSFTGCFIPMFDFLKAAAPIIPNLAGIKFTNEDFMDYLNCLHLMDGKFDMLWGRDEVLLSALALGARGGVGSTYNYAAPLYYKVIEAFEKGDLQLARKMQQKSIDMIMLLGKYGGMATGKAYMRYIGFDCGGFRSPVKNMSRSDYKKFANDVESLEMEKLFCKI